MFTVARHPDDREAHIRALSARREAPTAGRAKRTA
jgi:hypothetical protein